MDTPIRITIADDHAIFREGLRRLLLEDVEFSVVAEASTGYQAVKCVQDLSPDILLLDLRLPDISGFEVMNHLSEFKHRTIVLAADMQTTDILRALTLGAVGVVPKHAASETLFRAIRAVAAGQLWISRGLVNDLVLMLRNLGGPPASAASLGVTGRELDIIEAVVKGLPNKDIADRLGISEYTVKHHLTRIFPKLSVSNRIELVTSAINHGLVRKMGV
jgi:DNA-binding NarL/FixJ family response regulator